MITFVLNFASTNISIITRVVTSLLALIILIVAAFLMSEKATKNNSSTHILGSVLFVFATFVFLYANIQNLADVFTVWATLILAGVAILSFDESRRLREENMQREERERKERLQERLLRELDQISEWAQSLVNFTFDGVDILRSSKELDEHRTTGGSIKRQYSGVFSTIVDSEEMRNAFNSIDALLAFLNSSPPYNLVTGYSKAPELENKLHSSAENILIKADNARSVLLQS